MDRTAILSSRLLFGSLLTIVLHSRSTILLPLDTTIGLIKTGLSFGLLRSLLPSNADPGTLTHVLNEDTTNSFLLSTFLTDLLKASRGFNVLKILNSRSQVLAGEDILNIGLAGNNRLGSVASASNAQV